MSPTIDIHSLPAMDVAGRLGRLREMLEPAGCDALLVTKHENLRYLTAFSGSAGMLLVAPSGALLVTDGRYRDQAAEQVAAAGVAVEVEIANSGGQLGALGRAARGLGRIGLEAASVTWSFQLRLAELFEGSALVPTKAVVERLRVVKDEGELARVELACQVADVALAQVKSRITEGCTESEVAAELEYEMRRRGASAPAFETIVASGPNGAMPHARPTERQIGGGELVVVDFGATVDGYRSDMTRTLSFGEPSAELRELVDAVFAAQRAGLRAVTEGASGAAVDAAYRESLTEAGYGDAFLHSTGHGVGLEIHEAPAVAAGSADILPAGAVVTVEPGAYLQGRGGARIEDTVVVTQTGASVLTPTSKDLLVL